MAESHSSCCPIGSESKLAATHVPTGTIEQFDDLPTYVVGKGEKAIIFVYDAFGFDSGRTKLMCDQLAHAGYLVVLPDFFRGGFYGKTEAHGREWIMTNTWEKVQGDLEKHIYPYLETKGVKRIGMVGCCWGNIIVFKASATEKINSGVSFHPSINALHPDATPIVEAIQCPQLVCSASNDHEQVKEGSVVEKILKAKPFGDKCKVKDFPDMVHGWVPRGDLTKPEVARDVKEAMTLAVQFFNETL